MKLSETEPEALGSASYSVEGSGLDTVTGPRPRQCQRLSLAETESEEV